MATKTTEAIVMTEEHKKIIRNNFDTLTENIRVNGILGKLLAEGTIGPDEQEKLCHGSPDELLRLVMKREDRGFYVLIDACDKKCMPHLANLLKDAEDNKENGENIKATHVGLLHLQDNRNPDVHKDRKVLDMRCAVEAKRNETIPPCDSPVLDDSPINPNQQVIEERLNRTLAQEAPETHSYEGGSSIGVRISILLICRNDIWKKPDEHEQKIVENHLYHLFNTIVKQLPPGDDLDSLDKACLDRIINVLTELNTLGLEVIHVTRQPLELIFRCVSSSSLKQLTAMNSRTNESFAEKLQVCFKHTSLGGIATDLFLVTTIDTMDHRSCKRKLEHLDRTVEVKLKLSPTSNITTEVSHSIERELYLQIDVERVDPGSKVSIAIHGCGGLVKRYKWSSIIFTMQFSSSRDLEEFRKNLESGHLKRLFEEALLTDELKKKYAAENLSLTLTLADPQEYELCKRELQSLEGTLEPDRSKRRAIESTSGAASCDTMLNAPAWVTEERLRRKTGLRRGTSQGHASTEDKRACVFDTVNHPDSREVATALHPIDCSVAMGGSDTSQGHASTVNHPDSPEVATAALRTTDHSVEMDELDKTRLQVNLPLLVRNLRLEDVKDYLYAEGVLTDEDMETLSLPVLTARETVRKLIISILPNRGSRGFSVLMKTLRNSSQAYLADAIENTEVSLDVTDRALPSSMKEIPTADHLKQLQNQLWIQTELMIQYKREMDQLRGKLDMSKPEGNEMTEKFSQLQLSMDENGMTDDRVFKYMNSYMEINPSPVSAHLFTQSVTREVGRDIVHYMIHGDATGLPVQEPRATMRFVVQEILRQHADFFKGAISALDFKEANGFDTLLKLADMVLEGGEIHWGRIVSLYAFSGSVGALLLKQRSDDGQDTQEMEELIADFWGFYSSERVGNWIEKNGGWDAFVKIYGQKSVETKERRSESAWKQLYEFILKTIVTVKKI